MAIYNTSSDAANTMVRAFLTKIGESYLNHFLFLFDFVKPKLNTAKI